MRLLWALPVLLVGAVTAVAAVAVHGRWWGLGLVVLAVGAVLVALAPGWTTRLAFAAGFVPVVARLAIPRPEGDYAVADDPQGYLLLLLTVVVAFWSIATLPRPRRGRGPGPSYPRPRMSGDGHR